MFLPQFTDEALLIVGRQPLPLPTTSKGFLHSGSIFYCPNHPRPGMAPMLQSLLRLFKLADPWPAYPATPSLPMKLL